MFFKKKEEPSFVYDQCVIVEINFDSLADFGVREEQDAIAQLETDIHEILPASSGVDGDEFGEGSCTIYIYGPSADEIFGAIESTLNKSMFDSITITLQYGLPDNPETKQKSFSL